MRYRKKKENLKKNSNKKIVKQAKEKKEYGTLLADTIKLLKYMR
jgi:hypothetical protein